MKQSTENDGVQPRPGKRPYRSPELVEYGSVAKLTQGSLTTQGDATSGFKKACL